MAQWSDYLDQLRVGGAVTKGRFCNERSGAV
jgi:hypothetical protein